MTVGKILFLVSLLAAVGLAAFYRAKVQAWWLATKKFTREVRIEMQKVTWPTRNDIYASTIVVLVAVVVLTVIISIWDQMLSWIVKFLVTG